jgi:hypothetical protein
MPESERGIKYGCPPNSSKKRKIFYVICLFNREIDNSVPLALLSNNWINP